MIGQQTDAHIRPIEISRRRGCSHYKERRSIGSDEEHIMQLVQVTLRLIPII